MTTARWLLIPAVLAALCGLCLCGCGDDDSEGGDEGVALGDNHIYAAGDSWGYRLTGTYTPSGGAAIAFGPAAATLTYDATVVALGLAAVDTQFIKLEADFAVGTDHDEQFRHAFAITQDRSGVIQLVGLTPHLTTASDMEALSTPITGLDFAGFPTSLAWTGSGTLATYGDFAVDSDFEAAETISTPLGKFQTNRVKGTYTLDDFPVTLTTWLNPQVGMFVQMREQWEEADGSTMNLLFQLTSTTVTYEP